MGLFDKLKESMNDPSRNTLYYSIRKKLVRDGKEHIEIIETPIMTQKTISGLEAALNANDFELIDLDINPSSLGKGFQSIKVKYRSTK